MSILCCTLRWFLWSDFRGDCLKSVSFTWCIFKSHCFSSMFFMCCNFDVTESCGCSLYATVSPGDYFSSMFFTYCSFEVITSRRCSLHALVLKWLFLIGVLNILQFRSDYKSSVFFTCYCFEAIASWCSFHAAISRCSTEK